MDLRRRCEAEPLSWEQFENALLERFLGGTRGQQARVDYERISQGSRKLIEYISRVQDLNARISDMGETDRIHYFIRGLDTRLAELVVLKGPTTIQQAIEIATQIDIGLQSVHLSQSAAHRGGSSTRGGYIGRSGYNRRGGVTSGASAQSNRSSPLAVEVNNINNENRSYGSDNPDDNQLNAMDRRRPKRFKKTVQSLSREDMERCMSEQRCFNCKEKGHTKAECTSSFQPLSQSSNL